MLTTTRIEVYTYCSLVSPLSYLGGRATVGVYSIPVTPLFSAVLHGRSPVLLPHPTTDIENIEANKPDAHLSRAYVSISSPSSVKNN